ncbi:MAG TPA: hypothetical protein EYO59_00565, partial [Chromatiaceae bacterium]|nr:hypothetical protein [Chromatiaceae bacterium]
MTKAEAVKLLDALVDRPAKGYADGGIINKEDIKAFVDDWGQSDEELKANLEEIHNYEIEADAEFIMNTGNYFWLDEYSAWLPTGSYNTEEQIKFADRLQQSTYAEGGGMASESEWKDMVFGDVWKDIVKELSKKWEYGVNWEVAGGKFGSKISFRFKDKKTATDIQKYLQQQYDIPIRKIQKYGRWWELNYSQGIIIGGSTYADGGLTQRGWWEIRIEEDENDEELRLEEVAKLIREGYMSGYYPTWNLKITNIDGDLDENSEEHIANLVEEGYHSGEFTYSA